MESDPFTTDHGALLAQAGWVRRLASHLLADDHLAADVAQDVLTAAIDRPPPFVDNTRRLRAWLRAVARHLVSRRQRERRERPEHEAHAVKAQDRVVGDDVDPAHAIERLELHKRLTDAVLALPEPYRGVVIARYFDGLELAEIARRRGVSADAVRQQLHRGVAKLRAKLDREFGGRRAWGAALAGLLGAGPVPQVILGVTAMKKLGVVAIAVLVVIGIGTPMLLESFDASIPPSTGEPVIATIGADADVERDSQNEGPTTERAGVAKTHASDDSFILVVEDPAGSPVVDAFVCRWDDVGHEIARTDSEGVVELPARTEPASVLVATPGYVPRGERFAMPVGSHTWTLERGAVLRGIVEVDGAAPTEPIELKVSGARAKIDVPKRVRDALQDAGSMYPSAAVCSRADGTFEVEGLRPGLSSIGLPRHYWFPQPNTLEIRSERFAAVEVPAFDVRLAVTALPTIRGRFAWNDGNDSVGRDVSADLVARFADGETSPLTGFSVDDSGRFRVAVYPGSSSARLAFLSAEHRPAVSTFRIMVVADAELATKNFEFRWDETEPRGDVGTIVLNRADADTVQFVVRDLAGRPISGAHIAVGRKRSSTDAGGRAELVLSQPAASYLVGALGFAVRRYEPLSGSGTVTDPYVLVLDEGNSLTIRIRDVDGSVPSVSFGQVRAEQRVFSGADKWSPTSVHREIGSEFLSSTWGKGAVKVGYRFDERGTMVIGGLLPRVELRVRVFDGLRNVAIDEAIVGPEATEKKVVELTMPRRAFAVRGVVRDESGAALEGVSVELSTEGAGGKKRSDENGEFRFESIYVERVGWTLTAERAGFCKARREGVRVSSGMGPLQLVLSRGRDVRVRVLDSAGGAVSVGRVVAVDADDESCRYRGERAEPGVFVFQDLPRREVLFHCEIGGRRFEARSRAGEDECRIDVPAVGRLVVAARAPIEHPERGYLRADVTSGEQRAGATLADRDGELRTEEISLLPGKYSVVLQSKVWVGRENVTTEIGRRRDVRVVAGEAVVVWF